MGEVESKFIFFHMNIRNIYSKDHPLPIIQQYHLCHKSDDYIQVGLFLNSISSYIGLFSFHPMPVTHSINHCLNLKNLTMSFLLNSTNKANICVFLFLTVKFTFIELLKSVFRCIQLKVSTEASPFKVAVGSKAGLASLGQSDTDILSQCFSFSLKTYTRTFNEDLYTNIPCNLIYNSQKTGNSCNTFTNRFILSTYISIFDRNLAIHLHITESQLF